MTLKTPILRKKLSKLKTAFTPSKVAQKGINIAIAVCSVVFVLWFYIPEVFNHFWFGRLTGPLVLPIALLLAGWLLFGLIRKLSKLPRTTLLILCLCTPSVVRFIDHLTGIKIAFVVYLAALFVVATIGSIVALALDYSKGNKQALLRKRIWVVSAISIGFISLGGYLVQAYSTNLNPAFDDYHLADLTLPIADPSAQGKYKVKQLTYGSGKDLYREAFGQNVDWQTDSVDGTSFVENWKGMGGWLRSQFWEIDATQMPINGRVWYPDSAGSFPLVLMVHGNHGMEDFSDEGYEYLGQLLASRGYVFVSVDQNFINGTGATGTYLLKWGFQDDNDARAWLLLKHLQQWRTWQNDSAHTLTAKVDMSKTVLMGHSRGGEAAATAALFNTMKHYPDNALETFDFGFDIAGVVAIAPADGQYRPRGQLVALSDTNYLTIQGSMDGDAQSFMGSSAYARARFSGDSFKFKSSVYIYRANHSQFNDDWGRCDLNMSLCDVFNDHNMLTKTQQQQVAKVYISAFVDTVTADTVTSPAADYLPIFRNASKAAKWLPDTFYVNNYADSTHQVIANFEEDSAPSTAVGGRISAQNLSAWFETMVTLKWNERVSYVVHLGWNKPQASYRIDLQPNQFLIDDNSSLVFSLSMTKGEQTPLGFTIKINDNNGQSASVLLSQQKQLYPQIRNKPKTTRYMDKRPFSEAVMQYYQFNMSDFLAVNPKLNVANLSTVSFVFDQSEQGEILLDDVAWR
jgi:dienelactone hydrolase